MMKFMAIISMITTMPSTTVQPKPPTTMKGGERVIRPPSQDPHNSAQPRRIAHRAAPPEHCTPRSMRPYCRALRSQGHVTRALRPGSRRPARTSDGKYVNRACSTLLREADRSLHTQNGSGPRNNFVARLPVETGRAACHRGKAHPCRHQSWTISLRRS